jgi:hypothetical protein
MFGRMDKNKKKVYDKQTFEGLFLVKILRGGKNYFFIPKLFAFSPYFHG